MATTAHRCGPLRRHAARAGLTVLALAAVLAPPTPALAQEKSLEEANAWILDQIKARQAWETTRGKGVTVAVIDSGMGDHPYFEDKDVLRGYSTFSTSESDAWYDTDGHGIGVTAAVLQAAPDATILPIRTNNWGETHGVPDGGWGAHETESVRLAVEQGARIIVISWGVSSLSDGEEVSSDASEETLEAIQYAIGRDVVVVAGTGNNPALDKPLYPASIPGVVAVTGTDRNGAAWKSSTIGPETVLAAPADEHRIPLPQANLSWGPEDPLYEDGVTGTSFATGFVAGVAALVRAAHPDLDASNVIQRLIATADDLGTGGRTDQLGFGLVNADSAVHSRSIEMVDQNPLGYPLGAPGLSEDDSSGDGSPAENATGSSGPENAGASTGDSGGSGLLLAAIAGAAGAVLLGALLTFWLTTRARRRKQVVARSAMPVTPDSYPPPTGQPGYPPPPPPDQYGHLGRQPPHWGAPDQRGPR